MDGIDKTESAVARRNPRERTCAVCDCRTDLFVVVPIPGCFEGMNEAPDIPICMACANAISVRYCAGFSAGC